MVDIDLTFPADYEIEEIGDLPGNGKCNVPLFFFPRSKDERERSGWWLRISPANGSSWVGVFAFGYPSSRSISKVVSTPQPDRVCVVSRGAAYIVNVEEPDRFEEVPIFPVLDLRCIADHQLLVFADYTKLAAYSGRGIAWVSSQLCWDELQIRSISRGLIEGVGYNPIDSRANESTFAVDIETGRSLLPGPVDTTF